MTWWHLETCEYIINSLSFTSVVKVFNQVLIIVIFFPRHVFFFFLFQVWDVRHQQFWTVLHQLRQRETSAAVQLCESVFPVHSTTQYYTVLHSTTQYYAVQVMNPLSCFCSTCSSWSRRSTWRSRFPGRSSTSTTTSRVSIWSRLNSGSWICWTRSAG